MKKNKWLLTFLSLGLTISILPGCSSPSNNSSLTDKPTSISSKLTEATFTCEQTPEGTWATVANTIRGKIPMILWKSTYFSQSGWTPEKRCSVVTERFREYDEKGWLNYITIDEMNNQNVLCATENPEGKRLELINGGLLVTLRTPKDPNNMGQWQDPNEQLKKLLEVRDGADTSPVSHAVKAAQVFDSQGNLYINLEVFLSQAPVME